MQFVTQGDRHVPAIVTNKHVVEGSDKIVAICYIADGDQPSGEFMLCNIMFVSGSHVSHPDNEVDLCALPIGGILRQANEADKTIFL